ncbi:uncharacterized protein [Amphiura filiformis]|uniref:uncharacterized protein n=1 Tax=Amphiura filiformis TaxID=82378 RepID=UPI003B227C8B
MGSSASVHNSNEPITDNICSFIKTKDGDDDIEINKENDIGDARKDRYERSKGCMNAKGWNGKRKPYYTGRHRKHKKRKVDQLVFVKDDVVVYESAGGKVFKGVVFGKCETCIHTGGCYLIRPESASNDGRLDHVTATSNPRLLESLLINEELKANMTVLVTWQELEDGFVELKPARLVDVQDGFCWVHTKDGNLFRVGKEEMCNILEESQSIHYTNRTRVNEENVNVIRLVLHTTQTQLNQLASTYTNVKAQLEYAVQNEQELSQKNVELSHLLKESIEKIQELEKQLSNSLTQNQANHTLYNLVSCQNELLDEKAKQILDLQKNITNLREEHQQQQQELHNRITALEEELKQTQNETKETNAEKDALVHMLKAQHKASLKPDPYQSNNQVIGLRKDKTRYQTYMKVELPMKRSSVTNIKTLKRRAEKLHEILEVISSPSPQPDTVDIIATLAAYLKNHPEVALPACQTANIPLAQELTPQEVVDLKVLLRLPMAKLQDLRRFLANHHIKFMPSDTRLYKERRSRECLSSDIVEIGIMSLQKSAHSVESSVAFARVKNLEEYITRHVNLQFSLGKTWEHEKFNNEMWMKIGGDKGGTSTKLAYQLVNEVNANSRDGTNILAMFDAVDTGNNMKKVYDIYQDQLIDLQNKTEILVNGQPKFLRTFYYGDYEALCKSLGHMGPSSSFPCLWCNVTLHELRTTNGIAHCPKTKNKDQAWVDNINWPARRTVAQYVQDLADFEEHTRKGGRKVTGASFHSIHGRPLLPLVTDVDHVIPPSLHILLGLVVRYFKLLELECRNLDHGNLQQRDLEQFDKWQEASEEAKIAEVKKVEAEQSLQQEEELLKGMEKAKRGKSRTAMCSEACNMPLCALTAIKPDSVNAASVQWIQCMECGIDDDSGWFHAYCVGVAEESAGHQDMDQFVCPVCKGDVSNPADTVKMQQDRVIASKTVVKNKLEA